MTSDFSDMFLPQPRRVRRESDVPSSSFHDCHVRGIRWTSERFAFALDLDYILKWIEPATVGGGYRFMLCRALLLFRNVDDVRVSLDWTDSALECQIASLVRQVSRRTPSGAVQWSYVLEFSTTDGFISLWSTGYELIELTEPVEATVPHLGGGTTP